MWISNYIHNKLVSGRMWCKKNIHGVMIHPIFVPNRAQDFKEHCCATLVETCDSTGSGQNVWMNCLGNVPLVFDSLSWSIVAEDWSTNLLPISACAYRQAWWLLSVSSMESGLVYRAARNLFINVARDWCIIAFQTAAWKLTSYDVHFMAF